MFRRLQVRLPTKKHNGQLTVLIFFPKTSSCQVTELVRRHLRHFLPQHLAAYWLPLTEAASGNRLRLFLSLHQTRHTSSGSSGTYIITIPSPISPDGRISYRKAATGKYGLVEVQLHVFLTSVADGHKWPASRPGRLTFAKTIRRSHQEEPQSRYRNFMQASHSSSKVRLRWGL
jgi:hypothetical protein